MQVQLEDFLEDKIRTGPPAEKLIDGPRKVEIMKPCTVRGVERLGPDRRLGRDPEIVEVVASEAKELHARGMIRLLVDPHDRGTGPYDVYLVEDGLGYRPWRQRDPEAALKGLTGSLPETEFDAVFVPVRERSNNHGSFGPRFYLEFRQVQRCPVFVYGDLNQEVGRLIIDLSGVARPRRLAAA